MRRCRTRARARVPWSVLCVLMASLCSADVDVVVNLIGSDGVNPEPLSSVPHYRSLSSMDNSDLFVAMCLPGTFSPDNEGVCHDCQSCQAQQYETKACIPTRDRSCANCTVCGSNDIELCQCAVKTSQCVTGDRVCLKVSPTTIKLSIDFTSVSELTSKQQTFIRSKLAVGYTEWLSQQFDLNPDKVEMVNFERTGLLTYKATFQLSEIYGETKIKTINAMPHDFFQGGILYTFGGGRRRLLELSNASSASRRLLQDGLITVSGAGQSCSQDQSCAPFTVFEYVPPDQTCFGYCVAVPCPPGYGGGPTNCQLCLPGTFKDQTSYGECTECPAGFTSPTGANSSDACRSAPTTTTDAAFSQQMTTNTLASGPTSGPPGSSPQQPTGPSATTSPQAWSPSYSGMQQAWATTSSASPAAYAGTSSTSSQQGGGYYPPPPPPPSGGGGYSGGGGSNVNNNNVNNNVNVQLPVININVPAAPAPVLQPVFNNYVYPPQQQSPGQTQRMADSSQYHRHYIYDDSERMSNDWAMVWLLLVLAAIAFGVGLCLCTPGCPIGGYYHEDFPRHPRHYFRYRRGGGYEIVGPREVSV